ncbi:MAG: ABC transporter permease [Actinomycetota bacterium]|nr:MAG: ABC transporter permease [Actinomycetota bacterium]
MRRPGTGGERSARPSQPTAVRASRIRTVDAIRESVSTIAARPARSLLTMIGTVLGCAAVIAILGLTATAQGQITSKFNELVATTVTVADAQFKNVTQAGDSAGAQPYSYPSDVGPRLRRLNGVVDAGVYFTTAVEPDPLTGQRRTIAKQPSADHIAPDAGASLTAWGVEGGTLKAAGAHVASGVVFNDFHVLKGQSVAVLGPSAAANLGISSVVTNPAVFIGNDAYSVIGILSDTGSLPELDNAIMIPAPLAISRYAPPDQPAKALIRTKLGAAALIGRQAPYALDAAHPGHFNVSTPPDWSIVTDPVNSSLNGLLLALAAIALVIGTVAIANTTLVAVMERTGEIGLRQALGAKPSHISSQFLIESTIVGGLGGLLGSALGVAAILVGSAAQQWTPVLDPRLLLVAPALGVATGLIAGLYPSWRAGRIPPATALQRL